MGEYICKIATLEEIIEKTDYEIKVHRGNKIWEVFKERAIKNYVEGNTLTYIGILENTIICEATAVIKKEGLKDDIKSCNGLLEPYMAYLMGFRTNKGHEGKGYFLKLYNFMENDLKNRGYNSLSLGVEASETRNIKIYDKLGYRKYIKSEIETLPPKNENSKSKEIAVNFYSKDI